MALQQFSAAPRLRVNRLRLMPYSESELIAKGNNPVSCHVNVESLPAATVACSHGYARPSPSPQSSVRLDQLYCPI